MKGLAGGIFLLFMINCYGNDDDPGSTTYCETIGKVGKDKKCKRNQNEIETYISNIIFGSAIRCANPTSVRDLVGRCFSDMSPDLIKSIDVTSTTMSSKVLKSNVISKSENIDIGSLCNESKSPLDAKGSLEQSFFEYDPGTRSAIRVLRKQDPSLPENSELVKDRNSKLNGYIVPFRIDNTIKARWLVTFSGLIGYCYPGQIPPGLLQKNYFQIIEVKE